MCDFARQQTEALAAEILRYLEANPQAADTAEGIARWWVARQRLEDSLLQVQEALGLLVDESRLGVRTSASGRILYALRDVRGN